MKYEFSTEAEQALDALEQQLGMSHAEIIQMSLRDCAVHYRLTGAEELLKTRGCVIDLKGPPDDAPMRLVPQEELEAAHQSQQPSEASDASEGQQEAQEETAEPVGFTDVSDAEAEQALLDAGLEPDDAPSAA